MVEIKAWWFTILGRDCISGVKDKRAGQTLYQLYQRWGQENPLITFDTFASSHNSLLIWTLAITSWMSGFATIVAARFGHGSHGIPTADYSCTLHICSLWRNIGQYTWIFFSCNTSSYLFTLSKKTFHWRIEFTFLISSSYKGGHNVILRCNATHGTADEERRPRRKRGKRCQLVLQVGGWVELHGKRLL